VVAGHGSYAQVPGNQARNLNSESATRRPCQEEYTGTGKTAAGGGFAAPTGTSALGSDDGPGGAWENENDSESEEPEPSSGRDVGRAHPMASAGTLLCFALVCFVLLCIALLLLCFAIIAFPSETHT
jgi:hypothetical protein